MGNQWAYVKVKLSTGRPCPLSPLIIINYRYILSLLSVLQPLLMAMEGGKEEDRGRKRENDSAEVQGSWQSHSPPVHQSARWADGCMGEQMDGWPLSWRREGRAGCREVVLEMEEKKRGDINLAGGRPASFSLSLSGFLKAHACIHTRARQLLQPFLSVLSGPLHHIRSRTSEVQNKREGPELSGPQIPQWMKSERLNY